MSKNNLPLVSWAPHIFHSSSGRSIDFYFLLVILIPISTRLYFEDQANKNYLYCTVAMLTLGFLFDLILRINKQKNYAFNLTNTVQMAIVVALLPSNSSIAVVLALSFIAILICSLSFNYYNLTIVYPSVLVLMLFYGRDKNFIKNDKLNNLMDFNFVGSNILELYPIVFVALIFLFLIVFKRYLVLKVIYFYIMYTLFTMLTSSVEYLILTNQSSLANLFIEKLKFSNVWLSSLLLLGSATYFPTTKISRNIFIVLYAILTAIFDMTNFSDISAILSLFIMSIVALVFYLGEERAFIKNFEEGSLSKIDVGEEI